MAEASASVCLLLATALFSVQYVVMYFHYIQFYFCHQL